MAIQNGLVTVGTTPTLICASNGPLMLQNLSTTQTVTIGGPGVTAGHGIQLPFNAATPPPPPTQVPDMGGSATPNGDPIYGIVASTTASVTFMTASWDG